MQVVPVSHLDLTPFPALLEQAGVPLSRCSTSR